MNMLAFSDKYGVVFVCIKNNVWLFKTVWQQRTLLPLEKCLECGKAEINRIAIKTFRQVCYLIGVDNDDKVFVFNIDHMDLDKPQSFRPTLILKNDFPSLRHARERIGTWSFDLNSANGMLTLGSNSHSITGFSLQEESPSKLILATELHNIPNIQYSYHGTFLASCSISGRIVVYSGSPFKEIANLTHKNWMWSVTWISKSEVEELSPSLVYSKKSSKYGVNLEELEDYLLLCSDATKFYLIEFTRAVTQDGFKMNIISERKVRLPFLFGVPANSLRFSISTKLKGHPVVVSALQHSPLIVIIHISMYNGVYILSNREIGHGLDKVIVGMDAFLSTSPEGNVINILTLNFDTPSIDYIKLKLSKALLLAR